MDDAAKEYIIDFFSKRLLHFKDSPASVGWTEKGQILRYEWITKLLDLEGASILDFGCGKGDLYGFLKGKGLKIDYTGIDINPDLISLASRKYPEALFRRIDIEKEGLRDDFDFIIICGVFNFNISGVKDSAINSLKTLFKHTKKSMLFNCQSIYAKRRVPELYYYDPLELLSIALDLTKKVNLYHNLIEGEIFLIITKEV